MRTREALRRTLFAMLAESAFEDITVRAVTARAGTGYATFFRHYESLDELLGDIAAEEIDRLLAHTIPAFETGNSLGSCEALCAYVDEERRLWSSLLTGGAWPRVRETFIRKAHGLVPEVPDTGKGIPPGLAVVFATSAVLDILAWWLRDGSDRPSEEIAGYIDQLAVSAVV